MTDEELSTPGRRMQFLRKARGIKQVTLAGRLYVSQAVISQWEHDKCLPNDANQRRLAEELGTSRSFLFGERTESVVAL